MKQYNKSFIKRMLMSLSELEQYYLEKRKYDFDNGKKIHGYKYRRIINPFLIWLVKVDRIFHKEKIVVLQNKYSTTDKPVIFACAHIGGNDISRAFEVLPKHSYLFLGDPKGTYKDFNGLLLYLNGCVMIETRNKTDRNIGYHRCVEILKNKQNLLIFPEGAWNLSENELVMKLFPGTVKMALESEAIIVPVAIEQYGNTFYFNIGENIDYNTIKPSNATIKELTNDLRNRLATLKYDIIEKFVANHDEFTQEFRENFAEEIVLRCGYGYTVQDVIETRYNDKNITSPQEAFAHLNSLIPCKENAFLFDKRIKW